MASMFNCLTIVSSVFQFFGSIAILIALMTSYWNYYYLEIPIGAGVNSYNNQKGHINQTGHMGLIYMWHEVDDFHQGGEMCHYRYSWPMGWLYQLANGKQTPPNFEESAQLHELESLCLGLLLMSAIYGLGALATLRCHNRLCGLIVYPPVPLAVFGMGFYMAFQSISSVTQNTQWLKFDSFGWSFYVCIFGVIFQFIAAALYRVAARCCHSEDFTPPFTGCVVVDVPKNREFN